MRFSGSEHPPDKLKKRIEKSKSFQEYRFFALNFSFNRFLNFFSALRFTFRTA